MTPADRLSPTDRAQLTRMVMRKQAALSLRVSAVFLMFVLGLPLVNWLRPNEANAPGVGGFPVTWLFLGVLFYPITWLLSGYFIKASDRIEAQCAAEGRKMLSPSPPSLGEKL